MAIQLQGNGGTVAEVDGTTFRSQRVTARPIEYGAGGVYGISAQSGVMAVSLAANSEIFQWRYGTAASRVAAVYYVSISAGANVAAGSAVLEAFRMTAARAWTGAGSGGTPITLTGNNGKLRTSMATSEVSDSRIASTGALTAGTKVLDAQDMGSVAFGTGTGAITVATSLVLCPKVPLFDATEESCMPYICANQEGFIVRIGALMPAGMTWNFSIDMKWAEVAAF